MVEKKEGLPKPTLYTNTTYDVVMFGDTTTTIGGIAQAVFAELARNPGMLLNTHVIATAARNRGSKSLDPSSGSITYIRNMLGKIGAADCLQTFPGNDKERRHRLNANVKVIEGLTHKSK